MMQNMEAIITNEDVKRQLDAIRIALEGIRETALRHKADSERIDKIERMAKASWKSFDSVAFSMDSSGDCSTLGYDKADGVPMGYKASYREAIDAAPEPK